MSIASLSSIPIAYATASAGMHPSHSLPKKLEAIAAAGFSAAEIAFPDLEEFAASNHEGYSELDDAGKGDLDVLLAVAGKIRKQLDELGLQALTVMP
jgi:sugar phosphate isomerase/epimerase